MPVYIARLGDSDTVKIGRSATTAARLAYIGASRGQPLTLLREIPGECDEELWMQAVFRSYRLPIEDGEREWFRFTPAMLTIGPPSDLVDRLGNLRETKRWNAIRLDAAPHRAEFDRVADIEALCDVPTGSYAHLIQPSL